MSSGLGEKGIPVPLRSEQGEKWQLQEAAPSVPHCTSLLDMDPRVLLESSPFLPASTPGPQMNFTAGFLWEVAPGLQIHLFRGTGVH